MTTTQLTVAIVIIIFVSQACLMWVKYLDTKKGFKTKMSDYTLIGCLRMFFKNRINMEVSRKRWQKQTKQKKKGFKHTN